MSMPTDHVKKPDRWTEPRKALIRTMWGAGVSAAIIADTLNADRGIHEDRFTRNAVLGAIHRGKLGPVRERTTTQSKPRPGNRMSGPRIKRAPLRPRVPGTKPRYNVKGKYTPKPPRVPVVLPVPANARPLAELSYWGCKWPVNEAKPGEPHLFCGTKRESGEPYCEHHLAKARA